MSFRNPILAVAACGLLLAGCARQGEFDSSGGIIITRNACPAVAVPSHTADITLFDPPGSLDSRVQGGRVVVSKRVSRVALHFNDGELRAEAKGTANAYVNRAAVTLPAEIQERITRRRKAGDADAAIDPMADPQVREAVSRSSFELLVGFQLTQAQLQYNATR